MEDLKIILSKDEDFKESAIKIKKEGNLNVDTIYIEDLVQNRMYDVIKKDDVIFFLCNSDLIYNVIEIIEKKRCYILNKKFWKQNLTKVQIQKILYNSKVKVPKLLDCTDFDGMKYPLFCKSNKHASITFQVYNQITVVKFFEKFNKLDFYFEETVCGDEYKIYYIYGQVFSKNQIEVNENTQRISNIISKKLGLEIFSADLIQSKGKNRVIDVNPAPGFYLSNNSRKCLIDYIYSIGDINEYKLYKTI